MAVYLVVFLTLIFYLHTFYFNGHGRVVPGIYMNIDLRDVCKKVEQNDAKNASSASIEPTPDQSKPAPDQSKPASDQSKPTAPDISDDIERLYYGISNYPLTGDDSLTYRMYDMGQKNKHAIMNRAMWDKNSLIPYLEEELRDHANSIWWDDETLEHEF
jgi:hypothetical protein